MAAKKETKAKTVEEKGLADVDWSTDAGAGFEGVGQDDLGFPFMKILQTLSPELNEDKDQYLDDASKGDVILSTTKEIYADKASPMTAVPVGYQRAYVEWTPRDSGGGYVGTHGPSVLPQCTKNDRGQDVLPNGNIIVTTSYFFCNVWDEGQNEWVKVVLVMSSTQLKKARQWLNLMSGHKGEKEGKKFMLPMFSHKYLLSTVLETKGEDTWYGWKIEQGPMVKDAELAGVCREQHAEIEAGSMAALAAPATGTDVPF